MNDEKRKLIYAAGFLSLGVMLLVLLVLNVAIGSSKMTLSQVMQILFTREGNNSAIVWNIRLPRLLTAALLGGALAVSGFLLQTFFGNPIAGPFVLGISSSAKLVVALTMIGSLARGVAVGSLGMILAAFVGSMISMGAILLVSSRLKSMSLLIVCGIMIGYICSAVTDIVVTFASDSNIVNLHNWSLGSFSGMKWSSVGTIAVTVLATLALTFLLSKPMGAYQMGENYAQNMGVNVKLFRIELILLSSILSACVTAFAGPISFVGIAVPHLIKTLFRTARPIIMIPACFLGGGVFCLLCDLIARTLFAPTELSISSVTAVFGVPVVLWMLLKRQKSKEGS
jgi:iron complex transport system permease protein